MPTPRRMPLRHSSSAPKVSASGRTEHMFFFEGDRIRAIREMILADDEAGRRVAPASLLPMQRGDFEGLFRGHERISRDGPPARPAPARVRAPR